MIDFTKPCRRGHPKTAHHGSVGPDGYWQCNSCRTERAAGARSTHNGARDRCGAGHPYTTDNTLHVRSSTGHRRRICRQCRYDRMGVHTLAWEDMDATG